MGRIEFDESSGAEYCTADDVARWFEQYDTFDSATNPTQSEVESHIFEWMEYIDRETGHAWRANTVHEEMKNYDGPYYWWSGRSINLQKRHIREFDSNEGDKLEEWRGDTWNDWLTDSSKKQGRGEDYWLDKSSGQLWIKDRYIFQRHPQFRITYRYGNPDGPTRAVTMACAKLVAADLVSSDQYSMNIPGTEGNLSEGDMVQQWRDDAHRVIDDLKEVEYVEPY